MLDCFDEGIYRPTFINDGSIVETYPQMLARTSSTLICPRTALAPQLTIYVLS